MLPTHKHGTRREPRMLEDHFSPMEDALFRELAEDAELTALVDRLFPEDERA